MRKIACILASLLLVTFACKSDKKGNAIDTSQLAGKWWINTALSIDPPIVVGSNTVTDLWGQMNSCTKDNLQKFYANGKYTMDEGKLNCDDEDIRINTGTWKFESNKTIIAVTTEGKHGSEKYFYTLVKLSSDTMIFRFQEFVDYGVGPLNYTYTGTAISKQ